MGRGEKFEIFLRAPFHTILEDSHGASTKVASILVLAVFRYCVSASCAPVSSAVRIGAAGYGHTASCPCAAEFPGRSCPGHGAREASGAPAARHRSGLVR